MKHFSLVTEILGGPQAETVKEEVKMNFETIKMNYDRGLWSVAMVKLAVRKGVITKEQYRDITGKAYA